MLLGSQFNFFWETFGKMNFSSEGYALIEILETFNSVNNYKMW